MSLDATTVALRHINETRLIIERLITSSESFDYIAAKAALKELQAKSRELARAQRELTANLPAPTSDQIVPFPTLR